MTSLESYFEEVVFLTIELDISKFSKYPYSLKSEFIWVLKYLVEVWVYADLILDWAPLSILEISWATDV